MSNRAITWAYEQDLPSTTKFVLVALADSASNEDYSCYPGQQKLARMTGLDARSVRRHVKKLEVKELIKRERCHRKNGTRTSDRYILKVGDAKWPDCPMRDDQPPEESSGSGEQAANSAQAAPPPPSTETNRSDCPVGSEAYRTNPAGLPDTVSGPEPSGEPNNTPPGANAPTPPRGGAACDGPRLFDDAGSGPHEHSEVTKHEPKRGTRLAADWRPSEADRGYGRRHGFTDREIDDHAERFRNHFVAGPGRHKTWSDWHRAWCNWLGRETPRALRGGCGHDPGRDRQRNGSVAAALDYLLDRC